MATRSIPIVPCWSIFWAILSLVPTPSEAKTRTG
ncbi:unnamed protein product, partial [Plutella xylostella]